MKVTNVLLKGMLIFGLLSFVVFVILIVLGMLMSALGFTCLCYEIMAWSLIAVAAVSGLILFVGGCLTKPDGEACQNLMNFNGSEN